MTRLVRYAIGMDHSHWLPTSYQRRHYACTAWSRIECTGSFVWGHVAWTRKEATLWVDGIEEPFRFKVPEGLSVRDAALLFAGLWCGSDEVRQVARVAAVNVVSLAGPR